MRIDWNELPEAVTKEVDDRVGGLDATPAASGDHAEIASAVTGTKGTVFVKAAQSDLGVRSLRYELRVSEAVTRPYSPAVEWHFEADGWLVVGFEHCHGRQAGLSPGSTDLDLLDSYLSELGELPAPEVPLFNPQSRFGFAAPAMDGEALIHTDLNPANLIVTPDGLRIVDWAFATKAAPWVELAVLAQWLIGSGHTPEQAEAWLSRHPMWGATDPAALDDFAGRSAGRWQDKAEKSAASWVRDLAAWTGRWAIHRGIGSRRR
jgi:hypothetical protein